MSIKATLQPLADRGIHAMKAVAPLLTRLVFGVAFLHAGLGKFHHLDRTAEAFGGLGIPAPAANAVFIAFVETVGGLALILGLGTRIAALFLTCTMIVAMLTAHRGDLLEAMSLHSEKGLTDTAALVFFLAMLWLIAFGAGPISLDHVLHRRRSNVA